MFNTLAKMTRLGKPDFAFGMIFGLSVLAPQRTPHDFGHGVLYAAAFVQHLIHAACHGHIHLMLLRQGMDGLRGFDAFGHVRHTGEDVIELASPAEFDADVPVAGKRAGCCQKEIADSGQAGQRLDPRAKRHGQARYFRQSAGDERDDGVVAKTQPHHDAGRHGNDVL